MKSYLWLLALPCGCAIFGLVWLFRRANEPDRTIDTLIVPPVQKYRDHDDQLRLNAEARRAIANDRRRQASSIESGKPVESKIRMVRS